jgi:Trypsin
VRRLACLAVVLGCALLCAPAEAVTVIGGHVVDPSANPAIAKLNGCTGALIAPDRILTAAHCVDFIKPRTSRVTVAGQRYLVARWARDPKYRWIDPEDTDAQPSAPPFDAALVVLATPAAGVAPLAVRALAVGANRRARIIGYGLKHRTSGSFGTLRAASVVTRSDGRCKASLRRTDADLARLYKAPAMLCTQDPDGRRPFRSGCYGDSGAPLLVAGAHGWEVAGIDSWGIACGEADGDPEVYMEIPSVLDFVAAPAPRWAPEPVGRTRIDGTPAVGQTLTCVPPGWAGEPPASIEYRWEVWDGDAEGQTYTVEPEDADNSIRCRAEAAVPGGGRIQFSSGSLKIPG